MSLTLPFEAIDDLIYDARVGDLAALKEDLAALSTQHASPEAAILSAAVDSEPEAEGGSGSCLLHFPAANGNIEILNYLLEALKTQPEHLQKLINHRNHSGNTPLHWAALNTHLDCVKALVEAGADVSVKNDAGLDAVFLAERTAWSTGEVKEDEDENENESGEAEVEASAGAEGQGEGEGKGPMSQGRAVVEWLLSSDKGGELESGVGESSGSGAGQEDEKK
ncbi:hypothetical protein SI65_03914 [Aspergillus cristatus]|uniref:Uncharacterized protein n=1 Tax=Aspergillus cristatus TaxID=573508 RepID=A0A1E3BJA9_ASPCR|nr:hypothetical protein SI65_03914 [Aspergillus cristatus]